MEFRQQITATVFNVLSLSFSAVIVVSYWRKKPIHSFPLDIAILLCFSCVFVHFFYILVFYFPQALALTSIFLFFNVICCCLISIMSFTLLFNFGRVNYVENNKKRFIIIYASISISISLVISFFHFISSFYITESNSMMKGALYSYIAVIWSSIISSLVFLLVTAIKIKREYGFKEYRVKLLFYAFTPIVFYVPETINLILSTGEHQFPMWFLYVFIVVGGTRGLFFTLVFGMNLDIVSGCKNIIMDSADNSERSTVINPLMKTIVDDSTFLDGID